MRELHNSRKMYQNVRVHKKNHFQLLHVSGQNKRHLKRIVCLLVVITYEEQKGNKNLRLRHIRSYEVCESKMFLDILEDIFRSFTPGL